MFILCSFYMLIMNYWRDYFYFEVAIRIEIHFHFPKMLNKHKETYEDIISKEDRSALSD